MDPYLWRRKVSNLGRIPGPWLLPKRQTLAIIPVLSKHQQGSKLRGNVPHKPRVLCEGFNISLIARVEEDRAAISRESLVSLDKLYEIQRTNESWPQKPQNEKLQNFLKPLTCPRMCRSPSTSAWTVSVWWRWSGPRSGCTSVWWTIWCSSTQWTFLRWYGKCGWPPRRPTRPSILVMGSAWLATWRSLKIMYNRITPHTSRSNFSQLFERSCCKSEGNEAKTITRKYAALPIFKVGGFILLEICPLQNNRSL